jgi:hypothetical protein
MIYNAALLRHVCRNASQEECPMAKRSKPTKYIVLALLVAAGGYLYLNMGSMVTRTAEKIASDALGVAVDIGSIHVSLANKTVEVRGLQVSNPPGYRTPYAVAAKTIAIGLNTASKKLIDFKNIEVKGSEVYFEVTEHGINLDDLKKLANRKKQKESVGSEQVRVIVQHMVIDASVIHPRIAILDREIASFTMPAIRISGIGQGKGGTNAGEVVVQVMTKYLNAVRNAVSNNGVLDGLPSSVGDVEKTLNNAADTLKNLF